MGKGAGGAEELGAADRGAGRLRGGARVFILGPFFGVVVDRVTCGFSIVDFLRWARVSLEAADLLEMVFSESADCVETDLEASWDDGEDELIDKAG